MENQKLHQLLVDVDLNIIKNYFDFFYFLNNQNLKDQIMDLYHLIYTIRDNFDFYLEVF